MTVDESGEFARLRLEVVNAECLAQEARAEVARLEGMLKDTQCVDVVELRRELDDARVTLALRADELSELKKLTEELARAKQIATEDGARANSQLAELQAGSKVNADELKKLSEKLVLAEQLATEETARADRATLDAASLRQLNLNLTGVIQVLKQPVTVSAPAVTTSSPTHDDVQNITLWYKRRSVWLVVGCLALVMLITIVGIKLIPDKFGNDNATTPIVEQTKPASPASVVPSVQPATPARSSQCPYASLDACVDDMVKRVGGGLSDKSIREYGIHSCQRIGCQ